MSMPSLAQALTAGAQHLGEAAKTALMSRLDFASLLAAQGTSATDTASDTGLSALSSLNGDASGGLETVSLRIGSSFPEPVDRRMLATWLSYDDLERLVIAALSAPVVEHSVIFGMSDNPLSWWDNTPARHIGYRPQDSSAPFRAAIEARQQQIDPKNPVAIYQGGGFVTKGPY